MSDRALGQRLTLVAFTSFLVATVAVHAAGTTEADATEAADTDELPDADVTMTEFDPESFAEQAAQLPPGLVQAIERDLDMSAQRYLARAAAAEVASDVVVSLGDVATASWLDGQTLNVVVDSRDQEAAVAATGATVHVGDALTEAVRAARSQGRVAYPDRDEGRVVPVESELDGESDRSSLLTSGSDEGDTGGELSGGFGYWTNDTLSTYTCTAGFNGVTGDGDPAAITAGHCARGESGLLNAPLSLLGRPLLGGENDDEASGDAAELGTFVEGTPRFGKGHDAAVLSIAGDAWSPQPRVATQNGQHEQGPGLPVYDSTRPIAGAPACQSGVISGWTCGQILDAGGTVPVSGENVAGFLHSACTLPGDDGGPILIGNYALGVSSGTTWQGPECAETKADSAAHVAVGYALNGVRSAAELYDDAWDLSVYVGTPRVDSPVEGDVTGERPTIKGTVDAAAGATVVVTVDDSERIETQVQPDGTWTAPVDDALDPGSHSYTVTASHSARNSSARAKSTEVTETFEVARVASLAVATPEDGTTTPSAQPRFVGTGHPGARVTLEFDEESTSTVVDVDGTWSITPREADRAGRFDAILKQATGGTVDNVSVKDIGIVPGAPLVTDITDDVASGHIVSGTANPGSTVAIRVGAGSDGDANLSEVGTSPDEYIARAGDDGAWELALTGLEPGTYSITAVQAVDDLTSERSAEMSIEVSGLNTGGLRKRSAEDEDGLAETGQSLFAPVLGSAALLALGVLAAAWRRRTPTSA